MTTKNIIPTMDEVKLLLNKYFEASISPEEMAKLEMIASKASSGEISWPDKNLENDLTLIHFLSGFADATLTSVADHAPIELGERLDHHISTLAKDSRRKHTWMLIRRIIKYSAAAAVAGLIGIGGYVHLSRQDSFNYTAGPIADAGLSVGKEAVTSETIPQLVSVITQPDNTVDNTVSVSNSNPSVNATTVTNNVSPKLYSRKRVNKIEKTVSEPDANETYLAQVNKALDPVPPFTTDAFITSEEAFRVMPIGITAYVETSEILIQPFFTLHQSVNDIYDTVDKVSEAFSGVSSALEEVGNSLALLSNPLSPL